MEKIICICTGNTCRSPMAAALLQRRLPGADISSAGIYASPGARASAQAVEAMRALGYDISGHRARAFSRDMCGAILVPMTRAHGEELRKLCPGARIVPFLEGSDVSDPFGGSLESYRKTAFLLESAVDRLVKRLNLR